MRRLYGSLLFSCACILSSSSICRADDAGDVETRIKALEKTVSDQQQEIDHQKRILEDQRQLLQSINGAGSKSVTGTDLKSIRGLGTGNGSQPNGTAPANQSSDEQRKAADAEPAKPVGQGPKTERPEVTVISEQGGVLTPPGHLILEPSVEYLHDTSNNLTFRGIELQDTVLIGVIEASNASRDLVSPALTARYGITAGWDVDVKVPYVYRHDRLTFLIPQAGQPDAQRQTNLTGSNLGDIELSTHYQITERPPYLIGNLRFKSTTGEGPFDIKRDSQGVDEELATGSGFYSLEPSMTLLYPTDPAVLFATLSYQWNIGQQINKSIGAVKVGHVDPGDDIGVTVGMGFSVNDDFSFSLGFKYDYIFGTTTEVTSQNQTRHEKSDSLHLGQLLFGMAYRVTPKLNVNLDLQIGVTDDTPDMQATIRVPIDFDIF